jgi:hypothetical protein
MPAPRLHTLLGCIVLTVIGTARLPLVSALSTTASQPTSSVMVGNPWGVTFEETIAPGFALERVELLGGGVWQVTARLSVHEKAVYSDEAVVASRTPMLFISPPIGTVVPREGSSVREWIRTGRDIYTGYTSPLPWVLPAARPMHNFVTTFTPSNPFVYMQGSFNPSHSATPESKGLFVTPTAEHIAQHPTVGGASLVRITIPNEVFTALSSEVNNTRSLLIGVALMSHIAPSLDHIFSGLVRVHDMRHTPVIRSFTALTSTRYTFFTHTTLQVIETQPATGGVWHYIGVVTFGLEEGISAPAVVATEGFFLIDASIASLSTSGPGWKPVQCPSAPIQHPAGCATDLMAANASTSFCTVERIAVYGTATPVYRTRLQLGVYTARPRTIDNLFLRMLVEAVDRDGSQTQSFMNVQTPLLASSVRCGAVLVREPSLREPVNNDTYLTTDPVVMSIYSGTRLVPMTQETTGAPLIESSLAYPVIASSVANLHARGILDSIVTIALLGYDDYFLPILGRKVAMVDLISIHVRRDDNLYAVLDSQVRTGVGYTVDFTDKHITTSTLFDSLCSRDPTNCARRELMRGGRVLLPEHVHEDTTMAEDVVWTNKLFNEDGVDALVAKTFIENTYAALSPNMHRRLVWVDSTYQWDARQDLQRDHMLLIASYDVQV